MSETAAEFLRLFAEVEAQIRKAVKSPSTTNLSVAMGLLHRRRPYLRHIEDFAMFADVRNLIDHNGGAGHPMVTPTESVLERLREFQAALVGPRTAFELFGGSVERVPVGETLFDLLARIALHNFSQFPVVQAGEIVGLVTERSIARFLSNRVAVGHPTVDLTIVFVRDLIDRDNSDSRFRRIAPETPEDTLLGLFHDNPDLEAVLLTRRGPREDGLVGIVTTWDVSRNLDQRHLDAPGR